jgi:hypothetical protein
MVGFAGGRVPVENDPKRTSMIAKADTLPDTPFSSVALVFWTSASIGGFHVAS